MKARATEDSPSVPAHAAISASALVVAMSLVIARATMLESLRDPFDISPGALSLGRGPGAATTVVLNVLSFVPVLLVLLRRLVDRTYALRASMLDAIIVALGLWALGSTFWANDKFAAILGASTWCAFLMLLWTFSQVVRTHLYARIVAGTLVGILLIYVAQGFLHQFVDLPALKHEFERTKEQIFRDRGWASDSFTARQFEKRVISGQAQGFFASPNTFAAAIVLTMLAGIGAIVQRLVSRDEPTWPVILGLIVVGGAWTLWLTGSRTGAGTLALGVVGVIIAAILIRRGRALRRFVFPVGVAGFCLILLGIVVIGVSTGGLIHDSLSFRWNYWLASTQLFLDHPVTGVGWNSFGTEYLRYRLPEPSEEIKDPHNFLARVACELGSIGLVLIAALQFLLWRDATRIAPETSEATDSFSVKRIALIAVGGIAISCFAIIDFSMAMDAAAIELMKRLLYAGALFVGILLVALQSSARQQLDARHAPVLRASLLVAACCFLLHNLVDFALFETGSMTLFAMVSGAAVGVAAPVQQRCDNRASPIVATAAVLVAMGGAVVALGPIVVAESKAHTADELLRADRAALAAAEYRAAYDALPIANGDYALREARALIFARSDPARVRESLDRALAADEMSIPALRMRAMFERSLPGADAGAVQRDFDRILEIDPRNVSLMIEYAQILEELGKSERAREIFERAIVENARMHAANPRRNDRVVHDRFGDFLARSGAYQLARKQYQLAVAYDDSLATSDERRLSATDRASLERKLIEADRRSGEN
jgi:tetratricopeptide (TPR) repeat protein